MINNTSTKKWKRLTEKKLDSQFKQKLIDGLNCSPMEANAVVETMHEIYDNYLKNSGGLEPGQMPMTVVSASASPNEALSECEKVKVVLTLWNDNKDSKVKKDGGTPALRRHRLLRLCREAYQQGGLLTVEDLANRILNCGERTLSRDLQYLRREGIVPPLRSTVKDMGRAISHRELIIAKWLMGKEYSEIAQDTYHSVDSVQNYVSKFKRTIALTEEGFDQDAIAFLIKISPALVESMQQLYKEQKAVSHRQEELQTCAKKKFFKQTKDKKNEKKRKRKKISFRSATFFERTDKNLFPKRATQTFRTTNA